MIYVIGPKTKNFDMKHKHFFNVTSHSLDICKELSPFFLGPVKLYDRFVSKNVENAWQYSKVYEKFTENGEPTMEYFLWANLGWTSDKAVRYPMGKSAKPLYSWWDGHKYGYIDARKNIYVKLYKECAEKTDAYKHLKELYLNDESIVLWDFDGRDTTKSMKDVLNDPTKTCGHGVVLKMMLMNIV